MSTPALPEPHRVTPPLPGPPAFATICEGTARVYDDAGRLVGLATEAGIEAGVAGRGLQTIAMRPDPEGHLPMTFRGAQVCGGCKSPSTCREPGRVCVEHGCRVADLPAKLAPVVGTPRRSR